MLLYICINSNSPIYIYILNSFGGKLTQVSKLFIATKGNLAVSHFLYVDIGFSSWFPETQQSLFSCGNNAWERTTLSM